MASSTFWFIKLIIFVVLLCTFVQFISTQPLLDDDDEDQTQLDSPFFNNYVIASGRIPNNIHHKLNIPQYLYDDHEQNKLFHQNKQYYPDSDQFVKRIIMLPRVGRRSI
ncbi:unnamed protein product [Rotaria sordida]|uniref:Uncharacterized protein n=1 Tax=Rotaria sordida TaxID=392033 RepID=A0A814EI21_9BILA|nr:unnamed protein product [Rotaria sordida]CAF4076676.1 unnamed protein product [Rotaria sordida]